MTAESIAKALGGRKAGGCWMACCPAHEDRSPSLSIHDSDDGKVLVHCFAGCDQETVIAALRAHGLWPERHLRSRMAVRPKGHGPTGNHTAPDPALRVPRRAWISTMCW